MDSVVRIKGKTARHERAKAAKEKLEIKLVTVIDNHIAFQAVLAEGTSRQQRHKLRSTALAAAAV